MTRQIEISESGFYDAMLKYWLAVAKLPIELQKYCPLFEKFLSPANYTQFDREDIGLSITGTDRYKMVMESPHLVTLLAVYAAQRRAHIDKNESQGYEV